LHYGKKWGWGEGRKMTKKEEKALMTPSSCTSRRKRKRAVARINKRKRGKGNITFDVFRCPGKKGSRH